MALSRHREIRAGLRSLILSAFVLAALALPATAPATTLSPFIDLQEKGLTVTDDAVGLESLGSGTAAFTVDVGGPLRFAVLYWTGRDRPCTGAPGMCTISQPYKDQQIVFAGNSITGTIIGTESQPATEGGATNNIGYFADVTSLVSAAGQGVKTFTVADGNLSSNLFRLDGASLVVAYTDTASTVTYRLLLFDNLDFAFANDLTPGPTREMSPITMNHGAVPFARTAALTILAGDATAAGSDRVTISNNADLINCLDGSAGARWDADTVPVELPANTGNTTVRVASEPGTNPDELLWTAALLRVPVDAANAAAGDDCPEPTEQSGGQQPGEQPAGQPLVGPLDVAPQLSALRVLPKAFKASNTGGATASASGAMVSYTSSEPATVAFHVERPEKGTLVGGVCMKPQSSKEKAKGKRCTRYSRRPGTFTTAAKTGANSFRFTGRLNNGKLPAGPYRLVAVATDPAANSSSPQHARFRITPPAPPRKPR